jgi:outer membrane protein assembly factor BamB
VRDGIVVAADGEVVHVYELPDLPEKVSFRAGGRVVGCAIGTGVVALIATDASRNVYPSTEGRTWSEGWSLRTGARLWGPVPLGDAGVREDGGIMQVDSELCFVSQGGLVSALRIADGHILWEAAPDGQLLYVGRIVVLDPDTEQDLVALDARDGRVLARWSQKGVWYRDNVFVTGDELVGVDMNDTVRVFQLPAVTADVPPDADT